MQEFDSEVLWDAVLIKKIWYGRHVSKRADLDMTMYPCLYNSQKSVSRETKNYEIQTHESNKDDSEEHNSYIIEIEHFSDSALWQMQENTFTLSIMISLRKSILGRSTLSHQVWYSHFVSQHAYFSRVTTWMFYNTHYPQSNYRIYWTIPV